MSGLRASCRVKVRSGYRIVSTVLLCMILLISHCGSVDFFFFVNTGTVTTSQRDGLVVIIGTPIEEEARSVRVVEGEIPSGMEPFRDGTVRGIPEESGFFDFTLELAFEDQETRTLTFAVEIEDQ